MLCITESADEFEEPLDIGVCRPCFEAKLPGYLAAKKAEHTADLEARYAERKLALKQRWRTGENRREALNAAYRAMVRESGDGR